MHFKNHRFPYQLLFVWSVCWIVVRDWSPFFGLTPVSAYEDTPLDAWKALLHSPPFAPTDVSLFSPQTYPDAPPLAPAPARNWTETSLREELRESFAVRFPERSATDIELLITSVMDDDQLQEMVPDARLRAAFAHLMGTIGEAAIEYFRNGLTFETMGFASLPEEIIAMSVHPHDGSTLSTIEFNSLYEYEGVRLLSPIVLHEVLHSDSIRSGREERINTLLETVVTVQLMGWESGGDIAPGNSDLHRRTRTRVMALLNSRSHGALRPYSAHTGNVFPGGRPLDNFASAFTTPEGLPLTDESPGAPFLPKVLRALAEGGQPQPQLIVPLHCDAETEEFLDTNVEATLMPQLIVRVAHRSLRLNVTEPNSNLQSGSTTLLGTLGSRIALALIIGGAWVILGVACSSVPLHVESFS